MYLRKSHNWRHRDVQIRGLCRQSPWSTMEVSCFGQRQIGHVALYLPQQCVILLVDRHLHRCGLTHIRSHAASDSCCVRISVPFSNVRPGSYFQWLQSHRHGEWIGICVAGVSHQGAHHFKRLSLCSIRLQSHLVEVFLEPLLAVVEWWGRWLRKEVGSPEDYTVCYKSRWNEWQPTFTFNASWIQLCIVALRIAAGDSNVPAICSKLVRCCLFVCRDISWWKTQDISFLIDIKGRSSIERTSGDVSIKISPGSYMNYTLIIKS